MKPASRVATSPFLTSLVVAGISVAAACSNGATFESADASIASSDANAEPLDAPVIDTGAPSVSGPDGSPVDAAPADAGTTGCTLADATQGVFVVPGHGDAGSPSGVCGTQTNPCRSIAEGISRATATSVGNVYLARGSYSEDGIALAKAVALRGGFDPAAGWQRCVLVSTGLVDPSLTTVSAITATKTISASDLGGNATLDSLTITSKAAAGKVSGTLDGESLYGIFATGSSTSVTMTDVVVTVANGGDGADGADAPAPAAADAVAAGAPCPASPTASGAAGVSPNAAPIGAAGSFTAAGYVVGEGNGGSPGAAGGNGTCTPPSAIGAICRPSFDNSSCQALQGTPTAGTPSCGGKGGGGGLHGAGGGSSIAVFAAGATVSLSGGSLTPGQGGAGGNGGLGHGGGLPGTAADGHTFMCCVDGSCAFSQGICSCLSALVEHPGGKCTAGGAGGNGGNGSGGAGGWSAAIVKIGGAAVTTSPSTKVSHQQPGAGGLNGIAQAPAGQAADVLAP